MTRLIGLLALAGIGFLGGSVARARWFDASTAPAPAAALEIDHTADLAIGRADAAVTVRIFGDYECPACGLLERTLGDTLLSLARAGAVRVVYLQRPLASRTDATASAAVIACVPDRDHRWAIHRRLYEAAADGSRLAEPWLVGAMSPDGDSGDIGDCARSDSTLRRVGSAIQAARSAGFHEVPAVVVNDRHVRFRTLPALLRYIERAVAASQDG